MGTRTLIVRTLLGGASQARTAAKAIGQNSLWKEARELSRKWRVSPQLSKRMKDLGLEAPGETSTLVQRDVAESYGRSAFLAAKAVVAIRGLEERGIRVAAFKGLATIALLYGKPSLRTIRDADLLIEERQLGAALECLAGLGFRRQGEETLEQYLSFVTNSPGFSGNRAVTLYGAGGSEIDLHWEVSESLPTGGVLDRAERAGLLGSQIPVTGPADGLLLTVRHGIRENLAADAMFRDLMDASLWCELLSRRGQLTPEIAHDRGTRIALLAVTGILSAYNPSGAAATAREMLSVSADSGEIHSAKKLVELFHRQLDAGGLGQDVFYLVHSRPWRQIVRGLLQDWSGYRRSMRTFEQATFADSGLRARAGRLAKTIPDLRGLRLARELAKAKYGTG